MRVLFIGDIVGSPGRQIVRERLADIVAQRQIDLVIANGENSASGFGITPRLAEELLAMGIDVLTGGNHSWDRKEILEFMPHQPRLLQRRRPDHHEHAPAGAQRALKALGEATGGEVFFPKEVAEVDRIVAAQSAADRVRNWFRKTNYERLLAFRAAEARVRWGFKASPATPAGPRAL